MALTTSIVSYWKLDESSGDAADSVGGFTLTNANTTTYSTGKINNCGSFDASLTQYLYHADDAALRPTTSFTFTGWAKWTGSIFVPVILAKQTSDSAGYVLYVDTFNSNKLTWGVDDSTNFRVDLHSTNSTSADTWFFFVVWYDSDNNQTGMSVDNGTPVTTGITGITQDSGSEFRIGARYYPGSNIPFNGLIDEVGFWTKVLSSDEITQLYNGGAGLSYPFTTGGNAFKVNKLRPRIFGPGICR